MNEEVQKFLDLAQNSREASLMIAENKRELIGLEKMLRSLDFQKCGSVREIFNGIKSDGRIYFVPNGTLGKNVCNLLSQYPTGQINVFDGKDNLVSDPDYRKGSVLVLITKKNLEKIERSEPSLLPLAGLTWQK